MAIIYCILNKINHKKYIGFTSLSVDKRWKRHIECAYTLNQSWKLSRAIRKYGKDNFIVFSIEHCSDFKYCKNVLEPYYIKVLDSIKNGYNMTSGGEGTPGRKNTKKHNLAISRALTGIKRSNETCSKISKAKIGRKVNVSEKGLRNRLLSVAKTWEITRPDGNTEIVFSLNRFCVDNLHRGHLSSTAIGKRKHHKGFKAKLV